MLQNELQDTDVPLASEVDIAHDTTQIDWDVYVCTWVKTHLKLQWHHLGHLLLLSLFIMTVG
jgi:hypothetical protein